jgi:hypothetical protein
MLSAADFAGHFLNRITPCFETAIKTFHRLADLKSSTEDAAKAVVENTACMAMYCPDSTNTPIDVSWTCFKLGSRSPVSGYG